MPALPAADLDADKPVLLPVGRDYLRDAMRARRMTVTSLAAALGISRKHLSNVLNGRAPLIDPLLRRLCRALGVEPEFVICLTHAGPPPQPARHGFMKGWILWHGDLTEPMTDWEMLED